MTEYLTHTGTVLTVLDGLSDADEPIPYMPADDPRSPRVVELERLLEQSRDLEAVWQQVAKELQDRCQRMIRDIATLTGRSVESVTAIYVPEATGGASDPA